MQVIEKSHKVIKAVEVEEKTYAITLNEEQAHVLRNVLGKCSGNAFYADGGLIDLYNLLNEYFPHMNQVPRISVSCCSSVSIKSA